MHNQYLEPIVAQAGDLHEPAVNVAAVVTLAAEANTLHTLYGIHGGYDAAPTGGLLSVSIGGVDVRAIPVTAAGALSIQFRRGIQGAKGDDVVVTLAAAGAAVTGKVSVDRVSEYRP